MPPWKLSNAEWEELGVLLQLSKSSSGGRGRPRIDDDRPAAEACLYRFYHDRQSGYRTFGWNDLPRSLGVSPSTANRRFREWTANGSWARFWEALGRLREERAVERQKKHRTVEVWDVQREWGHFPVGDMLAELERAYRFFNGFFYGSTLPKDVAISLERYVAGQCLGYFCARIWNRGVRRLHHIALHVSVLGKGARPALAVLLHEMVHLRNKQVSIRDCNASNQYHNLYFRDVAQVSGLTCGKRSRSHGFSSTSLSARGREAIQELQPRNDLFRWKT